MSQKFDDQRSRLVAAGRLHWFHWLIVCLSLALTLSAWYLTRASLLEKRQIRFDREVTHARELLLERMEKYEDALRGGVAFVDTAGSGLSHSTWKTYADSLKLQERYPGINGIGVVHAVALEERDAYLAWQRIERPGYSVHPAHEEGELLPISYIVPVRGNEKAVGLDMAHEANRYSAAQRARSTGMPQLTGPIVLVQDAEQTPGFLFYAPFYDRPTGADEEDLGERFAGMVYAPFVVKKLIDGTLSQERRLVRLRLSDEASILYDELKGVGAGGLSETITLPVYGRTWTMEVVSSEAFRQATQNRQPVFILLGGLLIDSLLLWFFVAFSRANQRALAYADAAMASLRRNEARLARANEELLQFNYRTSHDLVAPLRTIRGYLELARDDAEQGSTADAMSWLERVDAQCVRLIELVDDLLKISRSQHDTEPLEAVDLTAEVARIRDGLSESIAAQSVMLHTDCALSPPLLAPRRRVLQIIENLLSNAIRYASPDRTRRWVAIRARRESGAVIIEVEDNGIGIPDELTGRVFEMFYRGPGSTAAGSGLGLYLVRQHVERMGAEITLQSSPAGTLFTLTIPQG